MTTIVWFRRDLRLINNPALTAAAEQGPIVPVFIHAPHEEAPWQPGAASNWWLHHSLKALQRSLNQQGLPLIVRKGDSEDCLSELIRETGATNVVWNRLYEPACIERDKRIKAQLRSQGINTQSYNSALLFEPWHVANKSGKPFRVFTPFWKHCRERLLQSDTTIQPKPRLRSPSNGDNALRSASIDSLALLPTINWDIQFYEHWKPGEEGALAALSEHLSDNLDDYQRDRDFPGLAATSRLSPHLHFGEISPWQIWTAVQQLPTSESDTALNSRLHFMSEVGWREFAYHLLYHFPETTTQPLNAKYQHFPWWRSDEPDKSQTRPQHQQAAQHLEHWQRGDTGISLVDAGMQELWHTGWMHNRVRMVVASLLTKNMGIHWLEGARWFWDTLVDADLASNTLGWQWAAGCGADAAPYFRIFNPDTQADRFDEPGNYRNCWLGDHWQQKPPCIDLKSSRRSALEAYEHIRQLNGNDAVS